MPSALSITLGMLVFEYDSTKAGSLSIGPIDVSPNIKAELSGDGTLVDSVSEGAEKHIKFTLFSGDNEFPELLLDISPLTAINFQYTKSVTLQSINEGALSNLEQTEKVVAPVEHGKVVVPILGRFQTWSFELACSSESTVADHKVILLIRFRLDCLSEPANRYLPR
jgi:hypothetical protein